ncbi:hypothetical protein FOA52_004375 [Chlamydomonas sp. UWO 241]|nr:hypothetical protein FOA52_004375 [Chlamydomonas sp. UWO 241]
MSEPRTAEKLYAEQFLRSLHSTTAPSPLTAAQASKAAAKAWAGTAANVRQAYEEMAHIEALQSQLVNKSTPLPAIGQAGMLPDVFVVRWELSASVKKFSEGFEDCYDYNYADTQDRTRNHHEMQVVGSSQDVYS